LTRLESLHKIERSRTTGRRGGRPRKRLRPKEQTSKLLKKTLGWNGPPVNRRQNVAKRVGEARVDRKKKRGAVREGGAPAGRSEDHELAE